MVRREVINDIFVSLASRTMAGMSDGYSKLNQDSIFVKISFFDDPNICLLAVFDGHGLEGHRVSGFLKLNVASKKAQIFLSSYFFLCSHQENLTTKYDFFVNFWFLELFKNMYSTYRKKNQQRINPPQQDIQDSIERFEREKLNQTQEDSNSRLKIVNLDLTIENSASHQGKAQSPEKAAKTRREQLTDEQYTDIMKKVCFKLNKSLKNNKAISTQLSGSTGVLVLIDYCKIIAANVGDSRAILLKRKNPKIGPGKRKGSKQDLTTLALTTDHTPEIPEEKKRIVSSGGEVRRFKRKIKKELFKQFPTSHSLFY